MRTVKAVDAGDILLEKATPIGKDETAGELFDRLAILGGDATFTNNPSFAEDFTTCPKSKEWIFSTLQSAFSTLKTLSVLPKTCVNADGHGDIPLTKQSI